MLHRRGLISGATAVVALRTLPVLGKSSEAAPSFPIGSTRFRICRKDREIGYHQVEITRTGACYSVVTTVAVSVKAGPITVYRFNHHCEEEWQDERLVWLRSTTNDDGRAASLACRRDARGLTLLAASGLRYVPADVLTSNSLWTARFPQQRQILDAREGDVIPVNARPAGKAMVRIRGWATAADAYEITTACLSGTILYLQEKWVGGWIMFQGETVTYELV